MIISSLPKPDRSAPALRRMAALAPLEAHTLQALAQAASGSFVSPSRRELLTEGRPIPRPLLLLEGWAARVRLLADGRRQFISFVLPGDVVGWYGFDGALAPCTVVALTAVTSCPLPPGDASPALRRALAIGRTLDEAYLLAQVIRLGRLNARERILDLLLELHDRLSLAGLADANGFELPLTQETLADALGLTSVHVNRMVQQVRRSGHLEWTGHSVRLPDIAATRCSIGKGHTTVVG